MGSCSENYGCFPLFLSAGTWWPLQGSNKPPSSFSHPSLSIHLSVFLLSHCCLHFFMINILLPFGDWEEIIAKWSCLCTLGTASWQKNVFLVILLLSPHNRLQKSVWWHTKLFKSKQQSKRNKSVSVDGAAGARIFFYSLKVKQCCNSTLNLFCWGLGKFRSGFSLWWILLLLNIPSR